MPRVRVGLGDGDTLHGCAQHSGGSLGPRREQRPPLTAWGQTAPNPGHTNLVGSLGFELTPLWLCTGAEPRDSDKRTQQPQSPAVPQLQPRCGCKARSAEGAEPVLVTGSCVSAHLLPVSSVRRQTWQSRTSDSCKVTPAQVPTVRLPVRGSPQLPRWTARGPRAFCAGLSASLGRPSLREMGTQLRCHRAREAGGSTAEGTGAAGSAASRDKRRLAATAGAPHRVRAGGFPGTLRRTPVGRTEAQSRLQTRAPLCAPRMLQV